MKIQLYQGSSPNDPKLNLNDCVDLVLLVSSFLSVMLMAIERLISWRSLEQILSQSSLAPCHTYCSQNLPRVWRNHLIFFLSFPKSFLYTSNYFNLCTDFVYFICIHIVFISSNLIITMNSGKLLLILRQLVHHGFNLMSQTLSQTLNLSSYKHSLKHTQDLNLLYLV